MAILTKITVNTGINTANVIVKSVNGGLQQTTKVNPVSLVSVGTGSTFSRFDQLVDVVEGSPANGDIVVYNASTDKYEVKAISDAGSFANIQLDGGSF